MIDINIETALSEVRIPHGMQKIPDGFIIINKQTFSDLKQGPTAWTNTDIYLIASVATTFRLAIVKF